MKRIERLGAAILLTDMVVGCGGSPRPSDQISVAPSFETLTPSSNPVSSPTPEIVSTPTPEIKSEPKVIAEVRTGYGSEPSVAVSPYDGNLVAMSYNWTSLDARQDGIRISKDGGKTWQEVVREPWRGHIPDYHGVVAWGTGPEVGSSRLWWTDAIVKAKGKVVQAAAYSDDLGRTWHYHEFNNTPPWIGGFPNITVDNNPESPNFGTTYVAYNWLESSKGVGLAVASSKDGKSWQVAQVPIPQVEGYPYRWQINDKPKSTSDGVDVLFYLTNMRYWNKNEPFNEGSSSNKGKTAYWLVKLNYDQNGKLKVDGVFPTTDLKGVSWGSVYTPETQSGFDIDHNDNAWMAFTSAGKIIIGNMNSGNSSSKDSLPWMEFSMPGEVLFKPSLAVGKNNEIFLGYHAVKNGMVGTYFIVSYDNGQNWTLPQPVTKSTWRFSSLTVLNGTGLREGIDVAPDGRIWYTYADNRNGKLSTYVAIIDLGSK